MTWRSHFKTLFQINFTLFPGPIAQTCPASHVVEVYGLPRMDSQEDEAIQVLSGGCMT